MKKYLIYLSAIMIFSAVGLLSETHKGKIFFKNGDVVKSKAIIIQDSVVKFKLSTKPNPIIVNKNSVQEIEVVDGNYGLYGLGIGLVLSLGYTNNARSYEDFYLTLAAGGAIGLLFGTLINDYHTIRFDANDNLSFFNGVKMMPEINQPNLTLINYSMSF